MPLSSSSRNLHNVFVPGQLLHWCIIYLWFDGSHTTLLTRSFYVTSQFRASTHKVVFSWVAQIHIKCVPDEPALTHYLGWRVQNLENPIFTCGFLSLNATNNSCRLHRNNCFCLWHLYAYIILFFPGSCLLYSSSSKKAWTRSVVSWVIALPFSGKFVQVSPFFASVLLQIGLNTLKLQNIQNNTFVTKNQEPKSIFAISLYLKRWLISLS